MNPLTHAAFAEESAATATLTISNKSLHAIPGDLFGQFLERPSWGGELGPEAVCDMKGQLSPEIERHLAGMHAPLVRFPFGTDGDYVDWQDLVDLPGRTERPITIGHKGDSVTNRFGYPEYFALAEKLGWRTILVTNLRDALYRKKPLPVAAAHAAALVDYALKAEADIAAVQVGNEGWFFWPPKPEERKQLGLENDEACARWLRECLVAYADAIHAVRPDLPLIADAPRPPDAGDAEKSIPLVWRLAVSHDDVRSRYRMLAAHAYAPMGCWTVRRDGKDLSAADLSEDEIWFALVGALGRFDAQGQCVADATAYAEIESLGYQAAVTEWNWNGWGFGKLFPQASFREGVPAALGVAGFMHGLLRAENVALATQSMLLGTQWGITGVRVEEDGGVGYLPQAEVVRLFAEHHGEQLVESELSGVSYIENLVQLTFWWPQCARLAGIDAVVTSDTNSWFLHLVNRQRNGESRLNVRLPEDLPRSAARMHRLTGDQDCKTTRAGGIHRTEAELVIEGKSFELKLPPASVSILVIPRPASSNAQETDHSH